METLADKIIAFNRMLDFKGVLPEGIRIMNPFREKEEIMEVSAAFYRKYYEDHNPRHLILGINPGRFVAGLTGIPFTDPKHLTEQCGIPYNGPKAHEPSSVFVYDMIQAYGGEAAFYSRFYISAVCPLRFTNLSAKTSTNLSASNLSATNLSATNLSSYEVHESVFLSNQTLKGAPQALRFSEVNYNYYDSRELTAAVYDFMVESLQTQLGFGLERDVCFCLGTGKNDKFLTELNARYGFFQRIVALEHPNISCNINRRRKKRILRRISRRFREFKGNAQWNLGKRSKVLLTF